VPHRVTLLDAIARNRIAPRVLDPGSVLHAETVIVVIPCYNEADRLSEEHVLALLREPHVGVLLVDDGSRDATAELLHRIAARAPEGRVRPLILPANGGKAEAVRAGMLDALARGADVVGYADADFATPPDEILHLGAELEASGASVALGARIARLGARIDRKASRHYLGRVFATGASLVLGLAVYDTQCGAKLFRDTPALRHALERPFSSRWAFDVELIGRLSSGGPGAPPITPERMLEVPLKSWVDVPGSKLSMRGALRAGVDLMALGTRVARRGSRGFFPD
jgi:glycosyltransferase involved in cell wall biosynthesis